jgi:hypothetical protein
MFGNFNLFQIENILIAFGGTTGPCKPKMDSTNTLFCYVVTRPSKPYDAQAYYQSDGVTIRWKDHHTAINNAYIVECHTSRGWKTLYEGTNSEIKLSIEKNNHGNLYKSEEDMDVRIQSYPCFFGSDDDVLSDFEYIRISRLRSIRGYYFLILGIMSVVKVRNMGEFIIVSWDVKPMQSYSLSFSGNLNIENFPSGWNSLNVIREGEFDFYLDELESYYTNSSTAEQDSKLKFKEIMSQGGPIQIKFQLVSSLSNNVFAEDLSQWVDVLDLQYKQKVLQETAQEVAFSGPRDVVKGSEIHEMIESLQPASNDETGKLAVESTELDIQEELIEEEVVEEQGIVPVNVESNLPKDEAKQRITPAPKKKKQLSQVTEPSMAIPAVSNLDHKIAGSLKDLKSPDSHIISDNESKAKEAKIPVLPKKRKLGIIESPEEEQKPPKIDQHFGDVPVDSKVLSANTTLEPPKSKVKIERDFLSKDSETRESRGSPIESNFSSSARKLKMKKMNTISKDAEKDTKKNYLEKKTSADQDTDEELFYIQVGSDKRIPDRLDVGNLDRPYYFNFRFADPLYCMWEGKKYLAYALNYFYENEHLYLEISYDGFPAVDNDSIDLCIKKEVERISPVESKNIKRKDTDADVLKKGNLKFEEDDLVKQCGFHAVIIERF